MAYTSLAEIQKQQELASALAKRQYSGNYATNSGAALSGLAQVISGYRGKKALEKSTEAQTENERIRQMEMQRLTEALQGKTQAPLQPGVMPRFSSPEVQDMATNLELAKALQTNKAQTESRLGTNTPSSVREWEYYNSLSPEQQDQYLGMKRGSSPINLGNEFVFPNRVNPAAEPTARMPIQPGPTDQPDFIGAQAAAREAGTQGAQIAAIPDRMAAETAATRTAERPQAERLLEGKQEQLVFLEGLIDKAAEQSGPLTTGIIGASSKAIPGTPAYDLSATVDTIKANIGFDKLQAMRDASPTGGALGQVSEMENRLLQATLGNLETSQSPAQFRENLQLVKEQINRIVNGSEEQFRQQYGDQQPSAQGASGAGTLTPQEQAELEQLRARFNVRP